MVLQLPVKKIWESCVNTGELKNTCTTANHSRLIRFMTGFIKKKRLPYFMRNKSYFNSKLHCRKRKCKQRWLYNIFRVNGTGCCDTGCSVRQCSDGENFTMHKSKTMYTHMTCIRYKNNAGKEVMIQCDSNQFDPI